jgi:hypothetical protein
VRELAAGNMKIRSFFAKPGTRFTHQEQRARDEYGTIFAGE